jgi:hypothetical protein
VIPWFTFYNENTKNRCSCINPAIGRFLKRRSHIIFLLVRRLIDWYVHQYLDHALYSPPFVCRFPTLQILNDSESHGRYFWLSVQIIVLSQSVIKYDFFTLLTLYRYVAYLSLITASEWLLFAVSVMFCNIFNYRLYGWIRKSPYGWKEERQQLFTVISTLLAMFILLLILFSTSEELTFMLL